jgi:hypothetical protein
MHQKMSQSARPTSQPDLFRECAKTVLTTHMSMDAKKSTQEDIQSCLTEWIHTHASEWSDPNLFQGFTFPTATVCRVEPSARKTPLESINDKMLQYVSSKIMDMYQNCHKQVTWSWSVLETYINQFSNEFRSTQSQASEPENMFRVLKRPPSDANVTPMGSYQVTTPSLVQVVPSQCTDPTVNRLHQCLLKQAETAQVIQSMKHEKEKFCQAILKETAVTTTQSPTSVPSTILETRHVSLRPRHQPNTMAPAPPQEVKFDVTSYKAYSSVRVPRSTFVSFVRTQSTTPHSFEPILKENKLYEFLHTQLQNCRIQIYQSKHPHEPLIKTRVNTRVLKRKREE